MQIRILQVRSFILRLRRMSIRSRACLAVIALFALVMAFAAYDGRRRSGRLNLEQVSRPDDVRELESFLRRLQQIKAWKPAGAAQDKLVLVAEFANLPSNRQCKAFSDLLRITPGNNLILNDSLELLSRAATNELLPKLRQDNSQAFALSLEETLTPTLEAERDESIVALLNEEKSQKLLRRLDIVGPPSEPGRLGRLWRNAFGKSWTNRTDWVQEFVEKGRHIKRLADWYTLLERTQDLPLAPGANGAGLWFAVSSIKYAGLNSTLNGKVQFRVPYQEGLLQLRVPAQAGVSAMQLINTGLELNGLEIDEPPPEVAIGNAPLRIRGLPSPAIVPEQLARALYQLGLPEGFSLSNTSANKDVDGTGFLIRFTATSQVLKNCNFNSEWHITGQTLDEVKQSLVELPKKAREAFEESLRQTTKFGDWPVRFEKHKDHFWHARIKLANEELSFSVHADEHCRLQWYGLPAARDKTALLNQLLQHDTRLANFAPMASLDKVQITESNVSGQLRLGSLSGIEWRIWPNGQQVDLSPAAITYLGGVQRELPQPTGNETFTVDQARKSLEAAVAKEYVKLAPSVRVEDVRLMNDVAWARLSMTVADWPGLDLGSYPIAKSADCLTALSKAMSQENVRAEVQRSWSQQHPRFGRVSVKLKQFNPREPTLDLAVSSVLPLTGTQLPWEESLKVDQTGTWLSDTTEEIINRQLEPRLTDLEQAVNATLQNFAAANFVMKLKVKRDAFGRGRWLKLNPLGIVLDGKVSIGIIPIDMEVVGIKIDCMGLHWPMEVATTLRCTVTAGPVALSDPSLRLNLPQNAADRLLQGDYNALGDITYLIGCKITPPSFGGVDFSAGLARVDNPWLHVIYLQAELGGRLKDPKLVARGKLVAIEENDLATASFEASLTCLDVHAQLRTLNTYDWLPSLNGELTMTRQVPIRAEAEMFLARVPLRGWLVYTTQDPPRIEGEMIGPIPGLGTVKFEARSDAEFKNPVLIGHIPFPLLTGWMVKVTVTLDDIKFEFVKVTPTGQLVVRMEFPDASAIDVGRLATRLAELEQRAKPTSPEEHTWLERATPQPPPATPAQPQNTGQVQSRPTLQVVDLDPVPQAPIDRRRPEPIPIASDLDIKAFGDSFRIYTVKDGKDVVRLKNNDAAVPDPLHTRFLVAYYKDSTQIDLFALDPNLKWVHHIRCADCTTVKSVNDWTSQLAGLGFFREGLSDHELLIRWEVVWDYALKSWSESEPTNPVAQDGGYSFRFKSQDPNHLQNELFTWAKGDRICSMEFLTNYISESEQNSNLRRLVSRTQEPGFHALIAADPAKDRLAVLKFQKGKVLLIPDFVKDPGRTIEMRQTIEPGCPRLGQVSRRLVLPTWGTTGQPVPTGTCYIGAEGACLVTEENEQLWLMRSSECTNKGTSAPVTQLNRKTFDEWDSDTKRHLPKNWQDKAARSLVPGEQIAKQAVASWAKQRLVTDPSSSWGAQPIGLLFGLALRTPR
jgi:hypothetical protein